MKNMESMKKGDIMKKDDIKEKLYVGFDIHKEKLVGTVMDEQGNIVLSGELLNKEDAVQSFFSGIPSPQVTIAIEACSIWRAVYRMLTYLGCEKRFQRREMVLRSKSL